MRDEFSGRNVQVIGVTDGSADDVLAALEGAPPIPVLVNADADRDAWGVAWVWGSVYYLVDTTGVIAARGLGTCEEHLRRQLDADAARN